MRALLDIVFIVLELYIWVLIIQAILSWLLVFNVVNARNQVVATIWRLTLALTEPVLKPIRRLIRPITGLDLAPLILILIIIFTRQVLSYYVYPNVF